MPYEVNVGRDRQEDHDKKELYLGEKGWKPVEDFKEIKINAFMWAKADPSEGSLFEKVPGAVWALNASPVVIKPTLFLTNKYIYVPLEPLKYPLNRIEAGHLTPVYDYK